MQNANDNFVALICWLLFSRSQRLITKSHQSISKLKCRKKMYWRWLMSWHQSPFSTKLLNEKFSCHYPNGYTHIHFLAQFRYSKRPIENTLAMFRQSLIGHCLIFGIDRLSVCLYEAQALFEQFVPVCVVMRPHRTIALSRYHICTIQCSDLPSRYTGEYDQI